MKERFLLCASLITFSLFQPTYLQTINCGDYLCDSNHSQCVQNSCLCDQGWTSLNIVNKYRCFEKQKSQITALLLEFFISFGAGHFYIERYDIAAAKFSIFIALILLNCISLCVQFSCYPENKVLYLLYKISIITCIVGILLWQIIDIAMYAANQHLDGRGLSLLPW